MAAQANETEKIEVLRTSGSGKYVLYREVGKGYMVVVDRVKPLWPKADNYFERRIRVTRDEIIISTYNMGWGPPGAKIIRVIKKTKELAKKIRDIKDFEDFDKVWEQIYFHDDC